MGKSFVVQTFIQQQIENGSTDNFAILVPTKALINEVRSNMIGALQDKLKALNYRVVTASGDLVLQQNHHFIFIMTPERLLHMMIPKLRLLLWLKTVVMVIIRLRLLEILWLSILE